MAYSGATDLASFTSQAGAFYANNAFMSPHAQRVMAEDSDPNLSFYSRPSFKELYSSTASFESNSNYMTNIQGMKGIESPYGANIDAYHSSYSPLGFDQTHLRDLQSSLDDVIEAKKKQGDATPTLDMDWMRLFKERSVSMTCWRELSAPADSTWQNMFELVKNFEETAVTYAQVIVSELCLPDDRKTVKPVGAGGIGGGKKYIVQGIFFKFAYDLPVSQNPPYYMYGGYEPRHDLASKALSAEQRNQSFLKSDLIHVPLSCLIDFKGFRVLAQCLLPISAETLIYGSADAGLTVHADDTGVNETLSDIAKKLNLKGHTVGKGKEARILHGPGDLEIHKGFDGSYYACDLGRVMPPEAPTPDSHPRSVFFQFLRSEYVMSYPKPLCSDAFTGWDCGSQIDIAENQRDLREATEHLFNVILPTFVRNSEQRFEYFLSHFNPSIRTCLLSWNDLLPGAEKCSAGRSRYNNEHVEEAKLFIKKAKFSFESTIVHRSGLNMRHLGRMAELSQNKDMTQVLRALELARELKRQLRRAFRVKMEQLGVPCNEPFIDVLVRFLNLLLLSTSSASSTAAGTPNSMRTSPYSPHVENTKGDTTKVALSSSTSSMMTSSANGNSLVLWSAAYRALFPSSSNPTNEPANSTKDANAQPITEKNNGYHNNTNTSNSYGGGYGNASSNNSNNYSDNAKGQQNDGESKTNDISVHPYDTFHFIQPAHIQNYIQNYLQTQPVKLHLENTNTSHDNNNNKGEGNEGRVQDVFEEHLGPSASVQVQNSNGEVTTLRGSEQLADYVRNLPIRVVVFALLSDLKVGLKGQARSQFIRHPLSFTFYTTDIKIMKPKIHPTIFAFSTKGKYLGNTFISPYVDHLTNSTKFDERMSPVMQASRREELVRLLRSIVKCFEEATRLAPNCGFTIFETANAFHSLAILSASMEEAKRAKCYYLSSIDTAWGKKFQESITDYYKAAETLQENLRDKQIIV